MRFLNRAIVVGVAVTLASACGGKVVFEENGGAGGTGNGSQTATHSSNGSTASHAATTGTGATDCKTLESAFDSAVAKAKSCNPQAQFNQCNGTQIINDTCGCASNLLNETDPDSVSVAKAAYSAWTKAGCGPHACNTPCLTATSGFCQPMGNSVGQCAFAFPD